MTPSTTFFQPTRVLEVEISQPLPDITAASVPIGQRYQQAILLVRLHGQPLGIVELTLNDGDLSAADYAPQIWAALQGEIQAHLQQDGLPAAAELTTAGLPKGDQPPCQPQITGAPFVSIIIATRDRTDSLQGCLNSLLDLDYPPGYEIIVVDNAPRTPATAELIVQCDSPRLRYLREDRSGVSQARNRGLMAAKGEIVAFTDDDVIVDVGWLARLMQGFAAAEKVACVTGLTLPAEQETPAQIWFEQYGGFNKGYCQRVFDLDQNRPQELRLFPYVAGRLGSGVNMALKTAVLRDMGGFDVALGTGSKALGGEDLALFFQIISGGYQLVYEPSALIYHIHRREYERLRRQMYGYGVGLTAFLTKCFLEKPRRMIDVIRQLPYGFFYAFGVQSPKNQNKRSDYPRELTNLERKGMLYGPFAYLYSRWRTRRA